MTNGVTTRNAVGRTVASAATPVLEDADGLDLTLRPGPSVWYEENWLVKDGKLTDFMTAYRSEFYSLARRIPGYRGYTVMTTMAPETGEPAIPEGRLKLGEKFIWRHPSILLNGTIKTEHVINIGSLMGRTYNVKIIHHLESWSDAETFGSAMETMYADEHKGAVLADHLARTVFPLVQNVWTSYFRLVQTSYPASAYPAAGNAKPGDADSLNLEPRRMPICIVEEGWDVRPGNFDEFVKAYDRDSYSNLRKIDGYRGYTMVTTLPTGPNDPKPTMPLGAADSYTVPYPGMLIGGDVRTDTSINAGAFFQKAYNVKAYHMLETWDADSIWMKEIIRTYAADHGGRNPWDLLSKTIFPLVNNHWDYFYRAVESSFVPR